MNEKKENLSEAEARKALHELRVYQVELETENEELRRTQLELSQARDRYFEFYNLAPVGYMSLSDKGLILEVNLTSATFLGGAREDLVNQPLGRFVLADDHNIFFSHVKNVFASLQPQVCDLRMVKKDGTLFWACLTFSAVRDGSGSPICRIVLSDISDRKQTAESLRKSEAHLRTLIQTIPDLVWLKNKDGVYLSCNKMFERFFGASEHNIIGKTDYDFVDRELAEYFRANDRKAITSGKPTKNEEWVTFADDGHRALLETSKTPMYDDNGTFVGVLGIGRDITDRKAADIEREKLQTQLNQAQKMEAVGRLAGGVAHDFNNMLSVILGYSELALEMTAKGQPLHTDLKEIKVAAHRSAELTRQLLAFARKQTVVPKVIDLNSTVVSMLSMLRRLIGEAINLQWQPGNKAGLLKIDPSQIDQILANLCINARDAIGDHGTVTVKTDSVDCSEAAHSRHADFNPGKYLMLSVSDSGCGMSEETQRKLFEPFFTTKEQGKGTGLGLASVYGIVKQNNGYIEVDSQLGLGTTFTIYLPEHEPGEERPAAKAPVEPIVREDEIILLVEDEPTILKMTAKMLERLGYSVLKTSLPSEAVEIAGAHAGRVRLLITDVIMPEINGQALAKSIQATSPGLKCLFMSGYTSDIIAHHGVLDEGVLFIQKPFNKEDLAGKIRLALSQDPD